MPCLASVLYRRAKLRPLALGGAFLLVAMWLAYSAPVQAAGATPWQPELEALQAYTQAREELRAGRLDQAEILLERTLMLQPEHAEARIDLVLLMAERGQTDAALALLQSLVDDPRTEPAHRQALDKLAEQIRRGDPLQANPYALAIDSPWGRSAAAPGLRPHVGGAGLRPQRSTLRTDPLAPAFWRGEVSYGASSNPMARTSAASITLTPAEGPVTLPLGTRAQNGQIAGAGLAYNTPVRGAEVYWQHTDLTDAHGAARLVLWHRLPAPGGWRPTAGFAPLPPLMGFVQAQRTIDGQNRLQTGLAATHGPNRLSLTHYQDRTLDDHGQLLRLDHSQRQWLGAHWLASVERSRSRTGPKGHWRASLGAELPLQDGRKLLGQWMRHHDTYPYSALLQQGARRQLDSLYVAYEQQHRLQNQKTLIWRVFRDERRSNLELFSYIDAGIQLSLVQQWR